MTDYHPIACDLHDLYEISIMRRQEISVRFLDMDGGKLQPIQPIDLIVENGEEYLVYEQRGNDHQERVRLDRLVIDRSS